MVWPHSRSAGSVGPLDVTHESRFSLLPLEGGGAKRRSLAPQYVSLKARMGDWWVKCQLMASPPSILCGAFIFYAADHSRWTFWTHRTCWNLFRTQSKSGTSRGLPLKPFKAYAVSGTRQGEHLWFSPHRCFLPCPLCRAFPSTYHSFFSSLFLKKHHIDVMQASIWCFLLF